VSFIGIEWWREVAGGEGADVGYVCIWGLEGRGRRGEKSEQGSAVT
jgi:hypothetical protein